jgi:hypothetical protein
MHSLFFRRVISKIRHGSREFLPPTYICIKKEESDRNFRKKNGEKEKM